MKKVNNKGLTLIELLVSVVIFAMLIVPVMNQLMQSLEMEQKSKRKQYETEYIESVMEYFKNTDLKVVESGSDYSMNPDSSADVLPIKTYTSKYFTIWRNTGIQYMAKVVCDPNKYTSLSSKTLSDLNDVTIPNAVNIDENYAAIIKSEFCNYDSQAAEDILLAKLDKVKVVDPAKYQAWNNGAAIFQGDKLSKSTVVDISKSATADVNGNHIYSVKCTVSYVDSRYPDCSADYVVFNKDFVDKNGNALTKDLKCTPFGVPSVYILYNQYVQDGAIESDEITINTGSGATGLTPAETAKVYILRNTSTLETRELYALDDVETVAGDDKLAEEKDGDIMEVAKCNAYKLVNGVSTEYDEMRYYLNGKRVAVDPPTSEGELAALTKAKALVAAANKCTSSLKDYKRATDVELEIAGTGSYSSDAIQCYTNMYTSSVDASNVETVSYDMKAKGSLGISSNFHKYSDDTYEDDAAQRIYEVTVTLYKATTDNGGTVDESTVEEVMTLVSSKEGN